MEVSVDTRVHRRDISAYQSHRLNDVEVLTLPELSRHVVSLQIDLRTFLFLRNLKAVVQLDNGMLIGKSPYGIQRAEAEG